MRKRLLMFVGRCLGRKFYWYGRSDLWGQPIKVCTTCGCHFVSDVCPSLKH
jgi:hypothetical protein